MVIKSEILKTLPMFSSLTTDENKLLFENSRLYNCERGAFLFMHGDTITNFYVVFRGTVQIFRDTPDGHEVTSDLLIAEDSLNADEIITKQITHNKNARAVDDTLLLAIPVLWMQENLSKFDHMATHLMASLSDRLHSAQIEAEHQSTMSATQIVACYLQRLCLLHEFDPGGFELPYSKTLIASRLRIELETFSRALKNLRDEGIKVDGSHVSFTDTNKTGHFVCDHCSLSEECTAHLSLHKNPSDLISIKPLIRKAA
ncbi:MAG: Crp/Fnr family transcriptional regulator [Rhodospirillales bacterium]|nr:Crp/Fnr family transcriptional regulator [Rhodospirillales bacterium]MCB9973823.1 Crp/Fnr family transcriptional regulator [Rhodospirillales bacterium]